MRKSASRCPIEETGERLQGDVFLVGYCFRRVPQLLSCKPNQTLEIAIPKLLCGTIVTRLDVTRRLGGMLAAAESSRLSLSGVSITPRVSKGLNPISAVSLARLIMPDAMPKPETEDGLDPARMAGAAS